MASSSFTLYKTQESRKNLNFSIADWRATLQRVVTFRSSVTTIDETQSSAIQLELHPKGYLEFDKTCISLLNGQLLISNIVAVIQPGERVLFVGDSGSGKSTLFRAVAGLWPWGKGKIRIPPPEKMIFLPQKPYIPLGTLANAVAYPHAADSIDKNKIKLCLERVNLKSLTSMLDEVARWDKILSLGQQQRLSFARVLLHKPCWVFLDEATSGLDEDNQDHIMSIFNQELLETSVLSIAHRPGLERYHHRTLHLIRNGFGSSIMISKASSSAIMQDY